MAVLPDIDTTQVGWIAYWNAIDQGGVTSIDPDDALSTNFIDSGYEIYDNGVRGTGPLPNGRECNWRVKNDGWIVVYTDRTESFNVNTTDQSLVRGYWDLNDDWNADGNADVTANALELRVRALKNNLSNSGSMTYSSSDVGLYNYEYTTPSTLTMLYYGNGSGNGFTHDATFMYTSDTSLHYGVAVGWSENGSTAFEGNSMTNDQGDNTNVFGSIDIYGDGLIPNSGVQYNTSIDGSPGYYENAHSAATILTFWS